MESVKSLFLIVSSIVAVAVLFFVLSSDTGKVEKSMNSEASKPQVQKDSLYSSANLDSSQENTQLSFSSIMETKSIQSRDSLSSISSLSSVANSSSKSSFSKSQTQISSESSTQQYKLKREDYERFYSKERIAKESKPQEALPPPPPSLP
jgi:hypothetical protein